MNKKALLNSLGIVAFWLMIMTLISLVMLMLDLAEFGIPEEAFRETVFSFILAIAQIIFSSYVAIVAFAFAKDIK